MQDYSAYAHRDDLLYDLKQERYKHLKSKPIGVLYNIYLVLKLPDVDNLGSDKNVIAWKIADHENGQVGVVSKFITNLVPVCQAISTGRPQYPIVEVLKQVWGANISITTDARSFIGWVLVVTVHSIRMQYVRRQDRDVSKIVYAVMSNSELAKHAVAEYMKGHQTGPFMKAKPLSPLPSELSDQASGWLGVLEYICAEMVEVAGALTRSAKRVRITLMDIDEAINADEELTIFMSLLVASLKELPRAHGETDTEEEASEPNKPPLRPRPAIPPKPPMKPKKKL